MTQAEVAARAELSASYISLLEANKKEPSFSTLRDIAESLRLPVDFLLYCAIDFLELRDSDVERVFVELQGLMAIAVEQSEDA